MKVGRSKNTWHPRESLEYRGREGRAREWKREKVQVVDVLENKFHWGLLSYMKNSTGGYKQRLHPRGTALLKPENRWGHFSTPNGCPPPSSETEELLVSSTEGSSDPSRIKQRCQVIGEGMKEKEVKSEPWVPKLITPFGPWARNDLTVSFCPGLKKVGSKTTCGSCPGLLVPVLPHPSHLCLGECFLVPPFT